MLCRTAAAAQPTRTMAYIKLFEVYRMQYHSPAPAGTLALCRPVKQCVMRLAALA